ncbi:hypothetical protein BDZ97DRAFT_1864426 [Flammula alnicola]|nr:hypothetical protein BDZ97DRAFT_1864426 [Flammula alnicola]
MSLARHSIDAVIMRSDGWIVGPQDRLLFWVPPSYRPRFYLPRVMLTIPKGIQLDVSRMAHGGSWHGCYARSYSPLH